jgi:hypothetical protein
MIFDPSGIKSHYAAYLYVQEWEHKKEKEKEGFTSRESAQKYLGSLGLLERICANLHLNDCTARYHAAKEYIKEKKERIY